MTPPCPLPPLLSVAVSGSDSSLFQYSQMGCRVTSSVPMFPQIHLYSNTHEREALVPCLLRLLWPLYSQLFDVDPKKSFLLYLCCVLYSAQG